MFVLSESGNLNLYIFRVYIEENGFWRLFEVVIQFMIVKVDELW